MKLGLLVARGFGRGVFGRFVFVFSVFLPTFSLALKALPGMVNPVGRREASPLPCLLSESALVVASPCSCSLATPLVGFCCVGGLGGVATLEGVAAPPPPPVSLTQEGLEEVGTTGGGLGKAGLASGAATLTNGLWAGSLGLGGVASGTCSLLRESGLLPSMPLCSFWG